MTAPNFRTVDDLLFETARKDPHAVALVDEEGNETRYVDLAGRAHAVAQKILKDAHVGLLARNSVASVAAYFGILRARAVVIWMNHSLDADALSGIIRDAGISVLLFDSAWTEKARRLVKETGVQGHALDALESSDKSTVHPGKGPDLASIVYTSGSTDQPLGVMLSHRNLVSNNLSIAEYMRLSTADRVMCVLPLYYIYGLSLLLSHFAVGGSVILDNRFAFAQSVVDAMEKLGATGFAGVPSHYSILLGQTDFASRVLPNLRYLQQAGDKMPPAAVQKLAEAFPQIEIFIMYGQTEASPRISYLDPGIALKKPGSVGKAVPGVTVRVVDKEGRECPVTVEGEVAASGDNIMMGYWNQPEETARVLRAGRLYTGDVGYKDADGDLFITGRKKQFIKVAGNRVSPLEIEAVSMGFPGVREAAAVGAADEALGERIRLYLVPEALEASRPEIERHLRGRLPLYKVPSEIIFQSVLPKTSQGKINRRRLASGRIEEKVPFRDIPARLGITRGDLLLVGSDVLGLAVAAQVNGETFEPDAFIDALLAAVSPEGTLIFPAFNFDFCEGRGFDAARSLPQTGSLARAALRRRDFQRTLHPIHSFLVSGAERRSLCALDNKSSFGKNSPFGFLHARDGRMLLAGLGYQGAFTFAHYVEESEKVSFRFHKSFRGVYTDDKGDARQAEYSMYVRDLERGVESDLSPIGDALDETCAVRHRINGVPFRMLSLREAYDVISRDIRDNGGRKLHRIKGSVACR